MHNIHHHKQLQLLFHGWSQQVRDHGSIFNLVFSSICKKDKRRMNSVSVSWIKNKKSYKNNMQYTHAQNPYLCWPLNTHDSGSSSDQYERRSLCCCGNIFSSLCLRRGVSAGHTWGVFKKRESDQWQTPTSFGGCAVSTSTSDVFSWWRDPQRHGSLIRRLAVLLPLCHLSQRHFISL